MSDISLPPASPQMPHMIRAIPRGVVIAFIGFFSLVDLFATQAILPALVDSYGVSRAAMGFAVNASTIGMAGAGLVLSLVAGRIDSRRGVWLGLALLSLPTAALAFAPDLGTFTALRILQGVFMASAFTLTMAYVAQRAGPADAASALAAYVTGIVAANLVGRLVAGSLVDIIGLAANFWVFAGLNLTGAALVALTFQPSMRMAATCRPPQPPLGAWAQHLGNSGLRAAFAIGFLVLFVFVGVFTYVNFELSMAPIALSPMYLGFVYLVFLPAMVTTPAAGPVARRVGARRAILGAMVLCLLALPLLLVPRIEPVLVGLALIGVGTFFAQAAATGYVSRRAISDRAAASGLYLASYYLGGLVGAALLGQIYDRIGWPVTVGVIGMATLAAGLLSLRLHAATPLALKPMESTS